ncbi:MAG: trypsin-like peptidase domain-containing protein [Rhodothermales bacterium]
MKLKGKVLLACFCALAFLLGGAAVTVTDGMFELGREADAASRPLAALDPSAFEAALAGALPAVVQIEALTLDRQPFGPDQLEQFFIPGQRQADEDTDRGLGSGIVVREDGFIVTSRHVLRNADRIKVTLADGTRHTAELIGTDTGSDLAVLRVDARGLTPARFADDTRLAAGQLIVAVGSPLARHLRQSATAGIISTVATRDGEVRYLQTDAALANGSAGSPLFNLDGRVAGLAQYRMDRPTTGVHGAVPAGTVVRVADALIARGKRGAGRLGLSYAPAGDPAAPGHVRVFDVERGGAADRAGIRVGDLIVAVEREPLRDPIDLADRVAAGAPGDTLLLDVQRRTDVMSVDVVLDAAARPAPRTTGGAREPFELEMGFTVDDLTYEVARDMEIPASSGVVVLHVDPSSDAYRESDLRGGMVIVEMAGEPVRNRDDFMRIYRKMPDEAYFLVICYAPLQSAPIMTALMKPCVSC